MAASLGQVLVGPAAEVTPLVVESPLEYQVVQRSKGEIGLVRVMGQFPAGFGAGDTLEVRWVGQGIPGGWREVMQPTKDQTAFREEVELPSGGWYAMHLRLRRGELVLAEAKVAHVGVGEVFVVAGQSNSANHGEERQVARTGLVSSFDGRAWRRADDPQPGASGSGGSFMPPFADALAERFKVPVGIVAAGAGGTSVREWLPRGARFPNPPTVTGQVRRLPTGEWESRGRLFDGLVERLLPLGPTGFRALLWHQGESDANQKDPSRTLTGHLYRGYLEELIRSTWREVGWEFPWFVAQASYHSPEDPGSPDIRAAQAAVCADGLAWAGPDTDVLQGHFRDLNGQGVHFSGPGLRAHAGLWVDKISPWLEQELAVAKPAPLYTNPRVTGPSGRLMLPGTETFTILERPAFVVLPKEEKRSRPQPWVFYGPTLPGYPDQAERWMHEQILACGVAVAGVDVGEAYGSPASHEVFEALHGELVGHRDFAVKPCLLGRSRGGLWVSSWAIAHPDRAAGLAGIYPVFDLRSYPGLDRAASAYGLTPEQLEEQSQELNPVARLSVLAQARLPVWLIHGDADTVVPLPQNSGELIRSYRSAGEETLARLIVLEGAGHSFDARYFHSGDLVDFVVERARLGAGHH